MNYFMNLIYAIEYTMYLIFHKRKETFFFGVFVWGVPPLFILHETFKIHFLQPISNKFCTKWPTCNNLILV